MKHHALLRDQAVRQDGGEPFRPLFDRSLQGGPTFWRYRNHMPAAIGVVGNAPDHSVRIQPQKNAAERLGNAPEHKSWDMYEFAINGRTASSSALAGRAASGRK